MISFILWYLIISLIGWLCFPLTYRLFNLLPDHGHGLSRVLGLIVWGYIFWMMCSLQLILNDVGGVLFVLILIGIINLWLGKGRWHELASWIRTNKQIVLIGELLFLFAFGAMAIIRAANPEIIGTEKPMELAFINAILRSPQFPPFDPWLSGYGISYYYFGYVIVAMLTRITGVISGVAFNLAIASWFGLSAGAAYSVLYCLFTGVPKDDSCEIDTKKGGFKFLSLLAPFYILVSGNVEGFLEMLHARGLFWTQLADGTWQSKFWSWLKILELDQQPSLPFGWMPERASGIWWWRTSRVLQDFDMSGQAKEIIDEIPIFSYILSDLHPHVLAMPFALLAVGLSLNLFYKGSSAFIQGRGLPGWVKQVFFEEGARLDEFNLFNWMRRADFWAAALIFGGLAFLNTWDFPIYLGIFSATYTLLRFRRFGWGWKRIWEFIELIIYITITGIILYIPFYIGFSSQAGGVLPSLSFFTRGVYFWVMFATLVIPLIIWIFWLWREYGLKNEIINGLKFSLSVVGGLCIGSYLVAGVFILSASNSNLPSFQSLSNLLFAMHGSVNFSQLVWGSLVRRVLEPGTWIFLLVMITLSWGLLSVFRKGIVNEKGADADKPTDNAYPKPRNFMVPSTPFVLLLSLAGMGLVLLPEYFYLRDQFGWRINTIFKLYFQTWILWGIAAGFASGILLNKIRNPWKYLFLFVWGGLLIISLAYPLFGILTKTQMFNPSSWTLDGTAHIGKYAPDEMKAIQFLQKAPLGIISEAIGGSYTGFARISTHSGMPTVLGWPGHESQWRGGGKEIGSRESDVELLYRTSRWDEALGIIQRYNIRYVYLGSLERNSYRANENLFAQYLEPIFISGSEIVYEVPLTLLSPQIAP